MAEIDSLEVKISANADKAARSLNELKNALSGLNTALTPAAKGLDSMVLSLSKVVGMQSGLTNISKTFGSLAKSWTALNQSTNKSAAEMAGISDKARTMSQVFAKEYGIKGKESVGELTNAFQKLYSSIGDNAAMGKALNNIESLIKKYAQLKGEVTEAGNVIKETLRNTTVKLPSTLTKELGSSLINSMSKLSHVSGTEGALPSEIVKEINEALDPERLLGVDKDYSAGFIDITGIDNEAQILEKLVAALRDAEGQTMTFAEASRQNQDVVNKLAEQLNSLATSVGTTFEGSISSYKDAIYQMMEVSPELARQLMSVDTAIDNIANNGNPFEGVLSGLTQLQDIHLSDSLNNLTAVKDAMGKFGGENATRAAANLPGIASALRQFDGVTIPPIGEDVMNLAAGLSKLGGKKIADGFTNLENIKASLMGINNLKIDPAVTQSIYQLAEGLYKFGLAKMDKAVSTIPALAGSITQLVNSLSSLPAVSENTIRLISALGNVNVNANTAANTTGGRLSRGLKLYTGNAFNARKASMSLAQAFGKMYANFFIFFRLARRFKNDIDLASDLTEVQNVVDVTFGDMADKMNEFSKSAIDALGMSELTAKRVGSRFQAMGTAMSISDSMVKSTNDFVQKATNGYADVADSMADVSINLTRLAGDMASFYNADYADVAEDLEAVFTGLTKPLRKYGIDLTQATLQEWALNHGMEANFKTMTQAEKTLLRYQYVMAQTTASHKDFERTQSTWANQIRIATERLNQLRIVLGKIAIYTFKPLVQSFNKAMEQIIKGAEGLLNALGKIFGWQIEWNDGGILNEEADDSGELADNMGDAADNAKKFKNFLLGIDELNVLPDNNDKDKGGAGGLGGLGNLGDATGGFNIKPIESAFDSIYDTLFKLGARINEIIKNLLKSIDWDKVYKKARDFGRGFARFVNGLLNDSETFYEIGKFLAGGVNAIANAIDAYHKEFDGWQWGVDIGRLVNGFMENLDWSVIKSAAVGIAHDLAQSINAAFVTIRWDLLGQTIAEGFNTVIDYFYTLGKEIKWSVIGASIASGINGFFKTFDFVKAAETLNYWAKGLLDALIEALDRTDWKRVGQSIGEFIARIDFISIGTKVVTAFWKALEGAFTAYGAVFDAAGLETTLGTVLFTVLSSKTLTKSITKAFRKQSKAISADIANLFNGKTLTTFMSGFIGADSRGIVTEAGTVLSNLKNGVNAVSASLDVATKAVGSLGVGFAEFFAVENTVNDLAIAISGGGGSLVKSIGALITEVGLASAAFSLLLGFPAGVIAAGVTAAVAAIFGLKKAMDQISEDTVISALAKDMGEAGVTLDQLSSSYKTYADNITSDIQRMNGEHNKLVDMKDDLADMLGGLEAIKLSAEQGGFLTSQAIEELVGDIGSIKDAWEEYIEAQYDYLIVSTRNNMRFIASQRELTAEETAYFDNKINELIEAKYGEVEKIQKLGDDAEEAWNKYYDAKNNVKVDHNGQQIYDPNIEALRQEAIAATSTLYDLADAQGVFGTGEIEGVTNAIKDMDKAASDLVVTFQDIDTSSLSSYGTAVSGFFQQINETYRNGVDATDEYVQSQVSAFTTLEQAQAENKDRYIALSNEAINKLNMAQEALLNGFYDILGSGDFNAATKYLEEVIKPAFEDFPNIIDAEGNKVTPYVQDAIESLMKEAFDVHVSLPGLGMMADVRHDLKSNWKDIFDETKREVVPSAEQSGKEIIQGYTKGISDATKTTDTTQVLNGVTKGIEESGSASAESAKYNDQYMDSLVGIGKAGKEGAKGVEAFTKSIKSLGGNAGASHGALQAMAGLQAQSGLALSGVINVKEELEKTVNAGKGVEDISNNFGKLGNTFTSLMTAIMPVKQGFDSFSTDTQMNMQKTTAVFGESFTSIMKYGNQTISWLKGSFVPYFSGAYWNSITSSIPNAFGNAFRQAINIMMNLWKQFATWANQNMKMNVNMRGKEVTGVEVEIPKYATGGFPEDGMFMANHGEMVGQFANGKTAVANNEQIVEGIRQGVYDAVSAAMSGGQGVTVELVGDASDIFTAVVRENNRTIMRTGASPIRN